MKLCIAFLAALLWIAPVAAQQRPIQGEAVIPSGPGTHAGTAAIYEATAITYPYDVSGTVELKPTDRIPDADGKVRVERKAGATKLKLHVDDMKPATLFGGDYNTYVFWAISPEGQAQNLGEVVLHGDNGELETSTKLGAFAMLVTAEPHYLVTTPSPMVVLKNTADVPGIKHTGQPFTIHYGYPVAYRYERETLDGLRGAVGPVRTAIGQAHAAVRLAQQARAADFAPQQFQQAQNALNRAVTMSSQGANKGAIENQAQEAVRLAVAAQNTAEIRAEQARLDAEREAYEQQMSRLEERMQQATNDVERARLQAERRQLQLRMEAEARQQAEQQARQAQQQASEASQQLNRAREQAQQLQQSEAEAQARAQDAEREAEQARRQQQQSMQKLENALNQIAETRETARGLVVNIPDVLFDFDKSTLRPEGRERLSKIAGIVLGSGASWNFAVEGHTDDVGSPAYNQRLSEQRAQSVANYLEDQGLPRRSIIEVRGLGETQPIASNSTAGGRQRNRRVEIIIQQPQQPVLE